jgi:flagellar basal-body rod protein FlgF
MNNTGYISLSRQSAVRRQMEVIANNIANASTPGFRAERLMFSEYVGKGAGVERMSFVQDAGIVRDLREGQVEETGNPLDLAIKGEGYFAVKIDDEILYTRNGRFRLDDAGQIVNGAGALLLDENERPINVGKETAKLEIARDGTVVTDQGEVGRIRVVRFENEQALSRIEGGLLRADQPGEPAEDTLVIQSSLEGSNVRPIVEITNMIDALRSYQNAQQMVTNEHDRVLKTIDSLTRAT